MELDSLKNKNNSFFLDIWNHLIKINESNIFIVFDIEGNIWFALKDLIKSLGYKSLLNIYKMKIPNEYINKIENIKVSSLIRIPYNFQPKTKFINEEGLNYILIRSNKEIAKDFINKYISDIMPEIRKTGKYILDQKSKHKLDKMNHKLNIIQHDNKNLLNNQRNVIYPEGNALYVIIRIIDNKKYYKVGYSKDLNKRLKVYNTSFPYKIFFNYYILVNDPLIDKCIKNIMRNEEFIKNKEYYKTSLNKIIKFIKSCDKSLNGMCCGYCLKCYGFDKIKLHKCKYQ
jgi:prophage antirepressor-like protein